MQQLGQAFVQGFLVPYIKSEILGNVENDERLQRVIRFDTTPTPTDISGLESAYFQNTGTILDTDLELRHVFWKEFIEFINTQKSIASGNAQLLTFRLLPQPNTDIYSKEADENLNKFGFYAVKAFENHIIDGMIKQKETSGEIAPEQADDDRRKLKAGELLLVRLKNGQFQYISDPQIKKALESVKKSGELLKNLSTQSTKQGEVAFALNPLDLPAEGSRERGSGVAELQRISLSGKAVLASKELEANGLFVEGVLKVDQNGVARGVIKDKNRIELQMEVSLIKPGEKVFKFTFVTQPSRKFIMRESELKEKFKNKKMSALDIFVEKQGQERKKESGDVKKKQLEAAKIKPGEQPESKSALKEKEIARARDLTTAGPKPLPPRTKEKTVKTSGTSEGEKKDSKAPEQTVAYAGAQEAKAAYRSRYKKQYDYSGTKPGFNMQAGVEEDSQKKKTKLKGFLGAKTRMPAVNIAKKYMYAIGGSLAAAGALSFLT